MIYDVTCPNPITHEDIRKALRHFYYKMGLLSFNYYESRDKYLAYINKRYVTWKKDLEYIKRYCEEHGIKIETHEEGERIYLKFHK